MSNSNGELLHMSNVIAMFQIIKLFLHYNGKIN